MTDTPRPTAEPTSKPIPPCNVGVYAQMLPKLREVAKAHGYAIGLHGSMQRDFDLMAMPWTEWASPAKVLVEAMAEAVQGYIPFGGGQYRDGEWKLAPMPAIRPHGRESWTISFYGDGSKGQHPFIDISIMPLLSDRDRLREELERAKAREKKLVAVVEDALSPGVFGPWSALDDPILAKSNLRELCDAVGYGAVMHYTEYLWKEKAEKLGHPGSEHTCAACASVRRGWIKAATDALASPDAGQGERGEKAT